MITVGTKVCSFEDLRKIVQMTSLCCVRWCSNTIWVVSTFPKVKKSSSWKTSICLHSHGMAWNKYYDVITKWMNFNCPVIETSESIEPNDNDFELNVIAYISKDIPSWNVTKKLQLFLWQLWTPFLHLFSPQRQMGKLKIIVEDFTAFWWHLGKQKRQGRSKQSGPNRWQSETFFWEALSKESIKAWLTLLLCNSSHALTKWSSLFIFGVYTFYLHDTWELTFIQQGTKCWLTGHQCDRK